nr:retrovirus-related Pol polyprotein from transposon TNT 1-94 [Tanacetum cinerariifolium]
MKDMGEASYVIGIEIHRDRARKSLSLSQKTYINKVLERPDLTFLVGMLSRYQSNPGKDHWKAAKKVLRYLQGIKDYSLTYRRTNLLEVVRYSDFDYKGFEFIACCKATSQALWLRNFISGLRIVDTICRPLKIFCDNSTAVLFSKNNKSRSGSKHIDIKCLKVRDHVGRKEVSIVHINTESMNVDPMTKGLPAKVFQDHVTPSLECMSGLARASSGEATWLVPGLVLSYDVAGLGGTYVTGHTRLWHPNFAIDDPKPSTGSYSQDDVGRLSAHVVKLRDILEGVLVLSSLSQLWVAMSFSICPSEPMLRFRKNLTPKDLADGTPSAKVIAKAEASKKQKASFSGVAPSYVPKHNRFAMDQSSMSTSRANLFANNTDVESDDDEDACARGFIPSAAEDPSTRDSQGNVIMTDAIDAFFKGAGHSWPTSVPAPSPSFQDLSSDTIHRDFFPSSPGPYYATYPEDKVVGSCKFSRKEWDAPHQPPLIVLTKEIFKDLIVCKTFVDQSPTPREMVWIKALTNDQLATKMSVLHCLMISHGESFWLNTEACSRLLMSKSTPLTLDDAFALKDTLVSPPVAKESIGTPCYSSLKFPQMMFFLICNCFRADEEWGVSHIVGEDTGSPLAQGSKRGSFGPNDVVVALSIEEKGNGSPSFPCASKQLLPLRSSQMGLSFYVAAFFATFLASSGPFHATSTMGLVLMPTDTSWLRNSSLTDASPVSNSTFGLKALGRYPTIEDLVAGTPSAMVIAKAEASKKRKASLSGAAPSHVSKCTRFAIDQSSKSTTRANLFADNTDVESDDDKDAYVEIPLVTPIRSAAIIPTRGDQAEGSIPPAAEDLSTRGKAIMTDATGASFGGAGHSRSTFPTPMEMVRIKTLSNDQLTTKISVLHYLMMSHGGELLARYQGLLKTHHEYVQSADFRLRSLQESAGFEHGLSMDQTQGEFVEVLKKIFRFVPGAQLRLAEASPLVAMTDYPFSKKVSDCASHPLSVIFQLEPKQLAHLDDSSAQKDTHVSLPVAKESNVTPRSSSLEFPSNDVPFLSVATLEQNKEWINVMVDMLDSKIEDGVDNDKLGVFSCRVFLIQLVKMQGRPWPRDQSVFPSVLMMLWLLSLLERKGRGAWYVEEHCLLLQD